MLPRSTLSFVSLAFSSVLLVSGCTSLTDEERQWLTDRVRQQLVFVDGGTFRMGDVGTTDAEGYVSYFTGDSDTHPVHEVTLDSFSIQKYETTFAEFDLYSKAMGEELVKKERRHAEHYQDHYPAKGMDWYQARSYCQWLGSLLDLPMDLPTEAQWEYAARSRGLDRKSTRLNSSHVKISYAVFCLK